jgi:predicted glycosyltransferase
VTKRVLFYCHNVFGLGHIVRSLRIAEACVEGYGMQCKVVTGCRSLDDIAHPAGIALERLPPVRRAPGDTLSIDTRDMAVFRDRAARIVDLVRAWRPDVLVADSNPLGLGGELVDALSVIRRERLPVRAIWGVPYEQRFPIHRQREALAAFESAMAYTDPAVEPVLEGLPFVPPHAAYVGFVAQPLGLSEPAAEPLVVGLCGGGALSASMFRIFCGALQRLPHVRGRFVAGPLAEDDAPAHSLPRIEVWRTAELEEAVRDAAVVVTRAGYNTTYALAATPLPLILAPLPVETTDQHARAERLRHLDGVFVVDERLLSSTDDLSAAITAALARGRAPRPLPFRIDGAARAAAWIAAE